MKEKIKVDVDYDFNWEGTRRIEDIEKDIQEMEVLGASYVEITPIFDEEEDDYINVEFRCFTFREETDDEYNERMCLSRIREVNSQISTLKKSIGFMTGKMDTSNIEKQIVSLEIDLKNLKSGQYGKGNC